MSNPGSSVNPYQIGTELGSYLSREPYCCMCCLCSPVTPSRARDPIEPKNFTVSLSQRPRWTTPSFNVTAAPPSIHSLMFCPISLGGISHSNSRSPVSTSVAIVSGTLVYRLELPFDAGRLKHSKFFIFTSVLLKDARTNY